MGAVDADMCQDALRPAGKLEGFCERQKMRRIHIYA